MDELIFYGGEIKALEDGKLGGYLIRFSSPQDPDLTQDYFDAKSAIHAPESIPLLYNHGLDATLKKRIIGKVTTKIDNVGMWAESQMNLRDEYEKAIYEMAKNGKLGYSSGALSHLVEREAEGKAFHIKTWFIGEASLTPTPAEPRNSVVPLKSLISPEEDGDPADDQNKNSKTKEVKTMDPNEVKSLVEEGIKAALAEREAKVQAEADRQAAIKAAEDAGYKKALDEVKAIMPKSYYHSTKKEKESDEGVGAFKSWLSTGDVNSELIRPTEEFMKAHGDYFVDGATKAAWNVTTGASGGYLVPDPLYNRINAKRNLGSWVRQAPCQYFTTPADHLLVPREDTSHTAFVLTAEAGSYNENEGTVSQKDLILYKYTKMEKVNGEFLMYQTTNWEEWLAQALGRAAAVTENTIYTVGTGTGEPEGVRAGATNSSLTLAAVDTIDPSEMTALIGKLGGGYNVPSECGWLMANATKWYLKGLTGYNFQYAPTPQGGAGNPADFHGFPAFVSDDLAPYTTESDKPVIFGNFNFYGVVEKPGMVVQRNPYLYMATGQIGIFASIFRGGGVLQSEAFYYLNSHA